MEGTIYIRMRNRVQSPPNEKVYLKDAAQIIAPESLLPRLKSLIIHQLTESDGNIVVVDVMKVIGIITEKFNGIEVQTIGPAQTIIEVVTKKKGVSIPFFLLIWFLLFFGSAMTLMNFHDDVSMRSVQEKIYLIITGEKDTKPLLFQISYSIGLGLGMVLFFNHVFKKRINDEPSPLEVEMFNYQMDLDNYVILHENKESMKRVNDD
ncbi:MULTISPECIES: stage V sporulation protein AA [Neobacillus]|uniref:Stage V sporulation protein AA n=1 Tax=Neobacillus sedimentimangrovi TaxID=2699460 RepID=A0ABS8QKG6_9BACI|nr:stage V sporulation protein AA [Neobacillus sedimentimangrovi]AIM15504.1 stage V sporulation protein AA [Bacillus sp. X1(2014)]MCD4839786.1 stage V sporulation protein AA [Neobacillus sedimentimangrovi]